MTLDAPATEVNDALATLACLADESDAQSVVGDMRALTQRLREGLFYVACLGQFKRGKSTLLNALVDEDILPVGVVPVTSVVTVLRFGPIRTAVLRFRDGTTKQLQVSGLRDFVSEDGNPENQKAVELVEVFLPSPLLKAGMCLVDTPGVGSVFANATETTRAFVPHVDAALVVLGADPPISGEELSLVRDVASSVDALIFVVNKTDRLSEQERAEAAAFCQRVLAQNLNRPIGPLLQVSALGQRKGDFAGDWQSLVELLDRLATGAGSDIVRKSGERWVERLARRLRSDLLEQRLALARPVEDTARRIDELKHEVGAVAQTVGDLGYLFSAEQERIATQFKIDRESFVSEAVTAAHVELHDRLSASQLRGTALWREATNTARRIAAGRLERWFATQQPIAEERLRTAARRLLDLANGAILRLVATGVPGVEQLPADLSAELGFRTRSRLFYTELWELARQSPSVRVITLFGSHARARALIQRDAIRYLTDLLSMNATRVQNDFEERVFESRRLLEGELRSMLASSVSSAERALRLAQATQAAGGTAVRDELARLDQLIRRTSTLLPNPGG